MTPATTYYVLVTQRFWLGSRANRHHPGYGATATFTTTALPGTPDPETPTTPDPVTPDPETPTPPTTPDPETPDPETPDPAAPTCSYEHRLTAVPGTTGAGFTSQIFITSKDATATVKISAFQADNGHAIDVLDSEGSAVGASTPLAPANSIKTFRLEGARGWHTVIVEHPTKAAMNNATVAMRLREPDTGVSVEHVPGIEHCDPATETGAPDLVMRNPQALLWPQTFDWRATVENIGDAPAAPTTVRVYSGARVLDTKAIDVDVAAGAEWPMSDYISRDRPAVGDIVRICVAPVPGEAVRDHANNCASATVERN